MKSVLYLMMGKGILGVFPLAGIAILLFGLVMIFIVSPVYLFVQWYRKK